jgi:lipoprotein-anchoring transpeptidase ErfK/SrfK
MATLVSMNSTRKFLILGALLSVLTTSCVQQRQDTRANTASLSGNSLPANDAGAVSKATEPKRSATVLTLPLLDALLTDEGFVAESRSTLQVTDEELDKLRNTARDTVLQLSDELDGENSRSTKTAVAYAKKQLQAILGNDRAERFIQLVDKYAENEDLAALKPNQIPTDTRVVVNTPAYRMDIFKDGHLVRSYKIGIGYPEFPLPTGLRNAKSIIFNPTWTPPDEPWVKGKVAPGKKVEAGSKLNPLGPVKIPIGLPNLIHGGKSPSRLGTFASHGCVGLTDALIQDFAIRLSALAGQNLTPEDVKGYEKTKTETREVKFDSAVPVELRYETIVLENGTLRIYRDVYEKGTNTEENLRHVLDAFGVSLDKLDPSMRTQLMQGLEQMAVDATGEPVSETDGDKHPNSKTSSTPSSGKVTKNIKGNKYVEFQIPALAGKGYPAPVGETM